MSIEYEAITLAQDREIARRVLDVHDYLLDALREDNRWVYLSGHAYPDPEVVLRMSVNIVLRKSQPEG